MKKLSLPNPESHWPWWYALVAFALSSMVLTIASQAFDQAKYAHLNTLLQFGLYAILPIAVFAVLNRLRKQPTCAHHFGLHVPYPKRTAWVVVLGTVGLLLLVWLAERSSAELAQAGQSNLADMGIGAQDGKRNIALILVMTTLAPVGEEMLFRAAMMGALLVGLRNGVFARWFANKAWWPAVVLTLAVLLSSQAFADSHGGGNHDTQSVLLYAMAVLLALAYAYTQSLWAPVLIHCLNNACTVLQELLRSQEAIAAKPVLYGITLCSPLLCIALLWLLGRLACTCPKPSSAD